MNLDGAVIDSSVIGGTTAAAGTFTTLTASGDLTVDTTTLKVDSTNNLVAIGTASPNSYNSNTNNYVIRDSGNGGMTISTGASSTGYVAFNDGEDTTIEGLIAYNQSNDVMSFRTASTDDRLVIDGSGNIGMGTASPSTNLHIYSTANNAPHLLLENYQNADTDDAAVIELYLNDETTGGIGDNTDVGVIRFTGDEKDGGSKETYAEIRGVAHDPGQGASNKGNLSIFVQAAGDLNETLTLDEKNVGIGTATPAKLLSLSETADGTKLRITRGGLCEWDFSIGSTSTLTGVGSGALELLPQNAGTPNEFAIGTAGSTAPLFHLTNSQNYFAKKVGIGTSSPSQLLHVSSTGSAGILLEADSDNVNEDHVGEIQITQDGGATYHKLGTNNDNHGYINVSEALIFERQGTEKMRMDNGGKLGIGTTSPSHKIEVSDGAVASKYDATDHVAIRGLSSGQYIQYGSGRALSFVAVDTYPNSGASTKMTLTTGGELLVGSTSELSPNARVFINAYSNSTNPALNLKAATTTSSGSVLIFFAGDNDEVGSVGMSNLEQGTGVSYNTGSDARWKDVTGEARGLEVINNLNPVAFNWKKSGLADEGLIAQEVQEHVPNIVKEGSNGYLQMDYGKLVTPLIKAVQEQQEQIEELKQQINELRGN